MRAPSLLLLSLSLCFAVVLTACPPPTTPPVAPAAPCMTNLVIASHESVGTQAPAPMTSEPLYDQSSLDALEARWMDDGLGSSQISDLRARLEQTQVIYASGSTFSLNDMKALQSAGFTDVEYSCPVAIPATVSYEVPPTRPGERRLDAASPIGWYLEKIGAAQATAHVQDKLCSNGTCAPVEVAVLDTGIDRGALSTALMADGWSGVAGQSCYECDSLGHGTLVASLIDEVTGGNVQLTSLKVLDDTGRGTTHVLARGLVKAAGLYRAEIINLSLAWKKDTTRSEGKLPHYMAEALAAVSATDATLFAAAGNTCGGPAPYACEFYPASAPDSVDGYAIRVHAVSSLTDDGSRSRLSTWNEAGVPPALWAPGDHLCNTSFEAPGYWRMSGSSFPTALASGALALLMFGESGQPTPTSQADVLDTLLYAELKGDDARLNLCATLAQLGSELVDCKSWESISSSPVSSGCYTLETQPTKDQVYSEVSLSQPSDYPAGAAYAPSGVSSVSPFDRGQDAVWCQSWVSSAPLIPQPTGGGCTNLVDGSFDITLSRNVMNYNVIQLRFDLQSAGGTVTSHYVTLPSNAFACGYLGCRVTGTVDFNAGAGDTLVGLSVGTMQNGAWEGGPLLRRDDCD